MSNDASNEPDSHVLVDVADGVCTIALNRPEKKNAFTVKMYEQCIAALTDAAADEAVRAVLFCGNGAAFTAGNDLADFMRAPAMGEESAAVRFLLTLVDYEKPIVVAVHGAAVGIGVTMLLHCDLVYVADTARLTTPFVPLGLVPEGAASVLLPRVAGFAKANEILLLGEPIDAAMAVGTGLAARVVPAAELLDVARARARRLTELPAASIRAAKKLMRDPVREQARQAIYREVDVFAERLTSPEAAEAFQAFFERRKPDFSRFG